jgi:uncharacterized protein (TIGR02452 family)
MDREERKNIFNETVDIVRSGQYTDNNGNKVIINRINDDKSIDDVVLYNCSVKKSIDPSKLTKHATKVSVVNQDCLYAAKDLIDIGLHPAVINNASFAHPGGGVRNGSAAQEENLCRRTNLFESIFRFDELLSKEYGIENNTDRHYPLNFNYGAIYSPSITVFRAGEDRKYEFLEKPFVIDVITIAAIKKPELLPGRKLNYGATAAYKRKVEQMLDLAILWGNDSVVLGAFGCGAYCTPPEEMATIFKEVISSKEYCDKFERIVFAILDDGNSHREHNPNGNFKPFEEIILG